MNRYRINKVKWWLLFTVMFAAFPLPTTALTLDAQVADGVGGHIASASGDMDCMPGCTLQIPSQALVSLFAVADKDYRFQGWNGACVNTIGPLCTLKPSGNISLGARFVKTKVPKMPVKALLLLHDEGVKHTVWNEFVKQHFNNRCPVVYGGVVLGEDSYDPHNNVYCYRIAFGYYDMLNIAAKTLQDNASVGKAKPRFSSKRLGYEVRAAALGLLKRHPKLSLTLVGQARAALAAQSFLQADIAENSGVVGLLALQQAGHNGADALDNLASPVLKLDAEPEQDAKISAALAQLTNSWWMAR
ncbi:MAG: hypothetical protein Q8N96_04055 [Methylovulum sp.]|nr:hypothetical protein [Methylovulum sp.]